MNMIKCALQFYRKSTQHCPNHYLQLLFTNQINSNQMLVFDERGKPEYPGKNLSWPHVTPSAEIELGPQVLSPLGQPCHR